MDTITLGYTFAAFSAFFLALTIILDKLLLEDYYKGNTRIPWFISSTFGTVLGLTATAVSWAVIGDTERLWWLIQEMLSVDIGVFGFFDIPLALAAIAAGLMTSQILRYYFKSFDQALPGLIAMVIAATPIFVFATELLLVGENWQPLHYLSVVVATLGLVIYGWTDAENGESIENKAKPLVAFMFFSVLFLVSLDEIFVYAQGHFDQDPGTTVTAALLPYYFIGYGAAIVMLFKKDVWGFVKTKLFTRGSLPFLGVIVGMEIIGTSADFTEAWSLGGITATLVALITGAHVTFVWLVDLYTEKKRRRAVREGQNSTKVLWFTISVERINEQGGHILFLQAVSIMLVLLGIALWP